MIVEIQFKREDQTMYAIDENSNIVGSWECHDDFVPGENEYGEEHESLPNGTYDGPDHLGVIPEITEGAYGPAYGNFYITTGDHRARDIHGGGSGCEDPYADYQGWVPTYGCLRMQNADGVELCSMMLDSDAQITLTVSER